MQKRFLSLLLAAGLLTGCAAVVEEPESSADDGVIALERTPGNDFYGYMNADDLMQLTLREDQSSTGTMAIIAEQANDDVSDLIKEIAAGAGYPKGSNEQLIHDLYHQAFDTNAGKTDTDKEDTEYLDAWFGKIDDAKAIADLYGVWGEMAKEFGFQSVPISVSVDTDLYHADRTIPSIGVYPKTMELEDLTEDDFAGAQRREMLTSQISLLDSTLNRDDARKRATAIVLAEMELAAVVDYEAMDDPEPEMIFHARKSADLDKELQHVTLAQIMEMNGLSFEIPETVSVTLPEQLTVLDTLLDDANLDMWKDYTRCALIEAFAEVLPEKYHPSAEDYHLPDDEFAVQVVKSYLSYEVGEEYAKKYCTEKMVSDVTKISKEIIAEYETLISENDWLSEEGKKALIAKLGKVRLFIGADKPHTVNAKDAEKIGDSLFTTICSFSRYQREKELDKWGKPSDQNGFAAMDPQVMNACYVAELNAFNITTAIMHAPLYDPDADYYTNLGGIGSIIGHEISHGFDANGMKYDPDGNYNPDWMPEADRKAFEALTDKVVDYYSTFKVLDSHHVDGKKTLSENLADISGVQCVLAIAKTEDNQKKVFESYAKVWEELVLDVNAKELIKNDPHSPASVRTNAVVACFDAFYDIYDVKETDALYVAPENRLRRW